MIIQIQTSLRSWKTLIFVPTVQPPPPKVVCQPGLAVLHLELQKGVLTTDYMAHLSLVIDLFYINFANEGLLEPDCFLIPLLLLLLLNSFSMWLMLRKSLHPPSHNYKGMVCIVSLYFNSALTASLMNWHEQSVLYMCSQSYLSWDALKKGVVGLSMNDPNPTWKSLVRVLTVSAVEQVGGEGG